MTRRRARGEHGTALVELTWLGILLLIPMLWIVVSVFEVQRGAFAVSAAARSAGRAYALAPTDAEGTHRAQLVARQALADLPLLPAVLGGSAPTFALDATHTVPIGQFQEVDDARP